MLELYPGAREVMLVRDFRDMIASMFAYNEKRGRQGFRRDRATSDRDYILDEVGVSVEALADAWARRSDTAHLLRYEDLVLHPEETVQALLAHLGLDAGPSAVEPMLGSLSRATAGRRATAPSSIRGSPSAAGGATSRTKSRLPAPRPSGRLWRPSGTSRRERRDGPPRRLGGTAAG